MDTEPYDSTLAKHSDISSLHQNAASTAKAAENLTITNGTLTLEYIAMQRRVEKLEDEKKRMQEEHLKKSEALKFQINSLDQTTELAAHEAAAAKAATAKAVHEAAAAKARADAAEEAAASKEELLKAAVSKAAEEAAARFKAEAKVKNLEDEFTKLFKDNFDLTLITKTNIKKVDVGACKLLCITRGQVNKDTWNREWLCCWDDSVIDKVVNGKDFWTINGSPCQTVMPLASRFRGVNKAVVSLLYSMADSEGRAKILNSEKTFECRGLFLMEDNTPLAKVTNRLGEYLKNAKEDQHVVDVTEVVDEIPMDQPIAGVEASASTSASSAFTSASSSRPPLPLPAKKRLKLLPSNKQRMGRASKRATRAMDFDAGFSASEDDDIDLMFVGRGRTASA